MSFLRYNNNIENCYILLFFIMYFLSKNKRIALSSRAAKCLVVLFVLTYSFNVSLAITDVQKLSVRSSFPVKLYCRTAYLLGINTEKCTNLDSSFSKEDT